MIDKMLNLNPHQLLKKIWTNRFSPIKRSLWNEPLNISYKIKKFDPGQEWKRNELFGHSRRNINTSKKCRNQDPYTVLGVSRNATTSEIKKQFRLLAKKYHPDINPSPDAKQKMANITAAYELLTDPKKKEFYDKTGMTSDDPNAHYDGGASNFGSAFSGFGDASFMFTDFAEMFTNMSSSAANNKTNATRGEDVQTEITLKFMEAIKGCEKNIRLNVKVSCNNCNGSGKKPGTNLSICKVCNGSGIQRIERGPIIIGVPCRNCSGNGQIINNPCKHCSGTGVKFQTKNITLDIPSGIKKGMQMRIPNQGHCGYRGGKSGHLFVTINIEPHPIFKWVDDNIYVDVPLTIKQCLLGGLVTVPTLNGSMDLLIKPKTYPNSEKVLKGKGPCKVDSHHNGDLIIKFCLKMPEKLTPRQVELIEEFNNIEMNIPYGKDTAKKETLNINNKGNGKFYTHGKKEKDQGYKQNETMHNTNKKEDLKKEKEERSQIPIPPSPPKQKNITNAEMQKDADSNVPIPPPPPKAGLSEKEKKIRNDVAKGTKGENETAEKTVPEKEEKQTMTMEPIQTNKRDNKNETKTNSEAEMPEIPEAPDQRNKMNNSLHQGNQEKVYSFEKTANDHINCRKNGNAEENNKTYDEQQNKITNENSTISYAKKWLANKFKSKG